MLNKNSIRLEIGYYFTAMTFLTRFPVSRLSINDDESLLKSSVYFPVIGVFVGLVTGLTYLITNLYWDYTIALAISISMAVLFTGAFHEDGFADVCDSMGAFDKEKKLLIMKDSRLGTYGVTGLICLLLLKYLALLSIAQSNQNLLIIFVIAHCLSRWSSLPLIYMNPYVSQNSKSGKGLTAKASNELRFIAASLFTVMIVAFSPASSITLLLVTLFFVYLSQFYFRKSLGGITGDCLGATNQLVELAVYLVFALQ